MIKHLGQLHSPERDLQRYMTSSETVSFDFTHLRNYLDGSAVRITVVLETPAMHCVMTPATPLAAIAIAASTSLEQAALKLNLNILNLRKPLDLAPIEVIKPWGSEIWFTGIEKRGVCTFSGIPIPWLLDCFCELLMGSSSPPPLLLKILKPRNDEVLGDLYFEVHTEKTEVYVVTEVDPLAWPDGIGKIRFGFDPKKRSQFANETEFRNAYLAAVNDYRRIRVEIDQQTEGHTSPDQSASPVSLMAQEVTARRTMEAFTSLRDLRPGDIVQVPPLTPHSLQHGVTVIEFQTPHYERYILSFAQRVLTQDHWDTEEALTLIDMSTTTPLNQVSDDLIADFESFRVLRIQLRPDERLARIVTDYAIIMAIIGITTITDEPKTSRLELAPGSALFIPSECSIQLHNPGAVASTVLIAVPVSA